VQAVSKDDLNMSLIRNRINEFDQCIDVKIGNNVPSINLPKQANRCYIFDEEEDECTEPYQKEFDKEDDDKISNTNYDKLLSAEVSLHTDEHQIKLGRVTGYKRDNEGKLVGQYHSNPLMNTRLYEVTFSDGSVHDYKANKIAEAIYADVDEEGHKYLLLDTIIDHRGHSTAMSVANMWITSHNGNKVLKRTTQGWQLCVQWRDGSTSWETLANLKSSHPLQLAEYAIQKGIDAEPAFCWWVPQAIHAKKRIVRAVKTRYLKRNQKFRINIPRTIEEALRIDKEMNTTYWADAIEKEMRNNRIAFQFLEPNEKVPPGYTFIRCHMNFKVKMDFTRKARFVAGGHMTDPLVIMTYSSVVSRDSVRIGFLLAALNDLDLVAADIGNAYLQASTKEKIYAIAGPEFGELQGKTMIIVRALYGLKSSGAAWHEHFANTLYDMKFKPSYADPDVWMRAATKPNGFLYYEYIFVYEDDLLILSHQTKSIVNVLKSISRLKEDEVGVPKMYLGAQVKQMHLPQDKTVLQWGLSPKQYIENALNNVEGKLLEIGQKLHPKNYASVPIRTGYRPELDYSPILSSETANFYQQLIGMLRWVVELGRMDIHLAVTLLSSYMMQPREGHLIEVLRIFSYLKYHTNSIMIFDHLPVNWDESAFAKHDWATLYADAKEELPPNMPEAGGNPVQLNCFTDADHAGNRITRQSHTGIIIFANRAPIVWYPKAQNTIESSTFGSEFVATRIAIELITALRYKLRMFGVPIDDATNMFVDKQSVVINATIPTSVLKKKHNAIAYHKVREAVAASIVRIAKVAGSKNLADLFTKPLS
jgi:hypothetical protein